MVTPATLDRAESPFWVEHYPGSKLTTLLQLYLQMMKVGHVINQ